MNEQTVEYEDPVLNLNHTLYHISSYERYSHHSLLDDKSFSSIWTFLKLTVDRLDQGLRGSSFAELAHQWKAGNTGFGPNYHTLAPKQMNC